MLSDVDSEDQRSAIVKRAMGLTLHLNGSDEALRCAFHRGNLTFMWDTLKEPIPHALEKRCEDMIHEHHTVTSQVESAVMRAIQLEYLVLKDLMECYNAKEINEFIRRLVNGLTDPVFWNGHGNGM